MPLAAAAEAAPTDGTPEKSAADATAEGAAGEECKPEGAGDEAQEGEKPLSFGDALDQSAKVGYYCGNLLGCDSESNICCLCG